MNQSILSFVQRPFALQHVQEICETFFVEVLGDLGGLLIRADRQRQLLEDEGVEFDSRGRVDLEVYSWAGPSQEWLQAHGLVSIGGS